MDRSRVALIIPAFNEADTISTVVRQVVRYGIAVVVDDASKDDTGVRAREAGAVVVTHGSNAGYDGALNSGFAKAAELGCLFAITLDADGQHNPEVIASVISALETGVDVVVGVRDRFQRVAEHVFSWVGRLTWGLRDPLCGLKGYRMDLYRELGHFDCFQSIGTELALYAVRTYRRVEEVPVTTRDRSSASRFGQPWSANKRIFRALGRQLVMTHHRPDPFTA